MEGSGTVLVVVSFTVEDVMKRLVGACLAVVILTWPREHKHVGTAEAEDTETGRYRCAAEATTRALELSVAARVGIRFDVQSVRMLREADANIALVLRSR